MSVCAIGLALAVQILLPLDYSALVGGCLDQFKSHFVLKIDCPLFFVSLCDEPPHSHKFCETRLHTDWHLVFGAASFDWSQLEQRRTISYCSVEDGNGVQLDFGPFSIRLCLVVFGQLYVLDLCETLEECISLSSQIFKIPR